MQAPTRPTPPPPKNGLRTPVSIRRTAPLLVVHAQGASGPATHIVRPPARSHQAAGAVKAATGTPGYGVTLAGVKVPVRIKKGLRSGVLFDVRTGEVRVDGDRGRVGRSARARRMTSPRMVVRGCAAR